MHVYRTPTNANSTTNSVVWTPAKFFAVKRRQSDTKGLKSTVPDPRQTNKHTNTPSLSQWRIEEAGDAGKFSCWRSIAGHGPAITSR